MLIDVIKNYRVINVSKGRINWSQRNNEYMFIHPKNPKLIMDRNSMCNVTSICMAASYNNWDFPDGEFQQPEDNFCKFLITNQDVINFYRLAFPSLYADYEAGDDDCYFPNEIHLVLEYGFNRWMGINIDDFSDRRSIISIFNEIINNFSPVVMSGVFPYINRFGRTTNLHHINVLVGLAYKNDNSEISEATIPEYVIIDDPYGAWDENFAIHSNRNDIWMSYDKFIKFYKPQNTIYKYGHFLKKHIAIV